MREFIYNWLRNSHVLYHPELKVGEYYEIDDKFLYCNFQALVDFVEIECSNMYEIYYSNIHLSKRNAVQGLAYLDILGDKYYKVVELYNWWKVREKDMGYYDYNDNAYKEDTQKLIELMSIRQLLWT